MLLLLASANLRDTLLFISQGIDTRLVSCSEPASRHVMECLTAIPDGNTEVIINFSFEQTDYSEKGLPSSVVTSVYSSAGFFSQ